MQRTQVETCVLSELTVKLADPAGNVIDTAVAYDVGVSVEFDYEEGDEEDSPQVYIKAVRSAGAQLQGERTTIDFWHGLDIQGYLVEADIDAICEAIMERYESRKQKSHTEGRISAALH